MSCRVFSRTLEDRVLQEILQLARKHECEAVRAVFRRTPKNAYAAAFLERLGFAEGSSELMIPASETASLQSHIMLVNQL